MWWPRVFALQNERRRSTDRSRRRSSKENQAISAYNVILDDVPHVVVLGEQPSTQLQEQLTRLLEAGSSSISLRTSWRHSIVDVSRNVARGAGSKVIIDPVCGFRWSRPNRIMDDPHAYWPQPSSWGPFLLVGEIKRSTTRLEQHNPHGEVCRTS